MTTEQEELASQEFFITWLIRLIFVFLFICIGMVAFFLYKERIIQIPETTVYAVDPKRT